MKVAISKETLPGENRVALIPANVPKLIEAGMEVLVESGAGAAAGFSDEKYTEKGAKVVSGRDEVFAAEIVLQVRCLGANPQTGRDDLSRMGPGNVIIGTCDPLGAAESAQEIASSGATLMALELIPRITRAQSMDVLSSQATIAGYRAVLLAAMELPKMFPLMMTAAGTLTAARVFVIGAGVAGLQAIATARRLGAVVQAYDVRPAVREQVESLGGKFVEMALDAEESEDKGGYAKAMGEEFYQKQRELMATVVAQSDVVITTAAIPGRKSPLLITQAAVEGMADCSVIVDLATERGGNCEPSQPDQRIVHRGVVILGPTNLPAEVPNHASQMFSNNVTKFLLNMVNDGKLELDLDDEIVSGTLVVRGGEVVHTRMREILDLPPLAAPVEESEESEEAPGDDQNADTTSEGESS